MSAFSAKYYILKNGLNLPIERCFIGTSSDEFGIDQCMIIRKQPIIAALNRTVGEGNYDYVLP